MLICNAGFTVCNHVYILQMERMKEAMSQYRNDDVMVALRDVTNLRAKVDDFISYNSSNSGMYKCEFPLTVYIIFKQEINL